MPADQIGVACNIDSFRRGMSELSERFDNGLRSNGLGISKECTDERMCIIVNLERAAGEDVGHLGKIEEERVIRPAAPIMGSEPAVRRPIGVEYTEAWDLHDPKYGHEELVLLNVVEFVNNVEAVTLARGKSLHRLEKIADRLVRCFYSLTGGLVVDPIACAGGKFQVSILCASARSDKLPCHVIEGGPKIVDSIAYYEGQVSGGNGFEGYANIVFPRVRAYLYPQLVRTVVDNRVKLPLQVIDVMIGSFDL